jgi:hypothetical protein
VKYASLRNRIAALEALLPTGPVRIRVTGGMPPPPAEPAKPNPGGCELAEQAAAFRRARRAPGELTNAAGSIPATTAAPDPKNAPAASVGAPAAHIDQVDQGLAPAPRHAPYRSKRHPA